MDNSFINFIIDVGKVVAGVAVVGGPAMFFVKKMSNENKKEAKAIREDIKDVKTDIKDFKKDVKEDNKELKKLISRVETNSIIADNHNLQQINDVRNKVDNLSRDLYEHIGSHNRRREDEIETRKNNSELIEGFFNKSND